MESDKPIIVIKKKGGHGGHHGGAWKIAYADFVTAMMAFFLVMWLVNSASTPTKERIASYFRRPGLFQEGSGTPLEIGGSGILEDAYVPSYPEEKVNETGESQVPRRKGFDEGPFPVTEENLGQKDAFSTIPEKKKKKEKEEEKTEEEIIEEEAEETPTPAPPGAALLEEGQTPEQMAESIQEQLEASPELEKLLGAVDISADADSLNIEIMDTEKTSMFASGSTYIKDEARQAFAVLGGALGKVKNRVEIVGHTDAHPFSSRNGGYSNWELSVDRANAARRLLVANGVDATRIVGVLGAAETQPKNPVDPFAASNRRITLKMKFERKGPLPTPTPLEPRNIDMGTDPLAGRKLQQASKDLQSTTPVVPETLERVHSLTPGEILQNMKDKGSKNGPGAWKDPKFPGEH